MENVKSNTNYYRLILRLKEALVKAGLVSRLSSIGVQAAPLAKHLGVSVQTIRKYLTGQAYPDLDKITAMADFLKVSPAWLAFGESEDYKNLPKIHGFEIKKVFLQEIIKGLFSNILDIELEEDLFQSICDFLYGIINDIAQLESQDEMKLRLIKTSIASASIMEKVKWKKLATII